MLAETYIDLCMFQTCSKGICIEYRSQSGSQSPVGPPIASWMVSDPRDDQPFRAQMPQISSQGLSQILNTGFKSYLSSWTLSKIPHIDRNVSVNHVKTCNFHRIPAHIFLALFHIVSIAQLPLLHCPKAIPSPSQAEVLQSENATLRMRMGSHCSTEDSVTASGSCGAGAEWRPKRHSVCRRRGPEVHASQILSALESGALGVKDDAMMIPIEYPRVSSNF